nr:hypothetical protein [Arthrobacter sp. TB 26]
MEVGQFDGELVSDAGGDVGWFVPSRMSQGFDDLVRRRRPCLAERMYQRSQVSSAYAEAFLNIWET